MPKRILVTGFDPFGGEKINSSWEAVKLLPQSIGDYELCKLMIPTVFSVAARNVLAEACGLGVEAVVCVGQAASRHEITPERFGVNLRRARIPDNAGNQPVDAPVIPGGPDRLSATVDVDAMVRGIQEAGFPAAASSSAGTFVCNDVLYTLLYHCRETGVKVGFIHVPRLPSQGEQGMIAGQIRDALTAAIRTLCQ